MLDSWIAGGGVHCHTNDQPDPITVPEPATPLGLLVGVAALALIRWRRHRR